MGKLKFQEHQFVTPNHKAPLYLRSRAEKGSEFKVLFSHGEGYYELEDITDKTRFKVAGAGFDAATIPEGTKDLVDSLKEEPQESKSNSTLEEAILPENVKDFINSNSAKIEELKGPISKTLDEIRDRSVINTLAHELHIIPSPKVYKLMSQLVDLNPELGSLSIVDLYKKAEGIMENVEN
jgi:hypothetical protein